MVITESVKRRFVKDYSLPINLVDEPYFTYFLELYDKHYGCVNHYNNLVSLCEKAGNAEIIFELSNLISSEAQNLIGNSNAMKLINDEDMNTMVNIRDVQQADVYNETNLNKNMISIDLSKANFNVFCLYGLKEELQIKDYNDLIKKIINEKVAPEIQKECEHYFINSKYIRQVIFGNLNPKRQQTIQKNVLYRIKETLKDFDFTYGTANSDELIIKLKPFQEVSAIALKKHIEDSLDSKYHFFKVEKFDLERVHENHFVKNTRDDYGNIVKKEFKNTPNYLMPQIYKKYHGLENEINTYDLTFIYEGFISTFNNNMFELDKKPKNKKSFK